MTRALRFRACLSVFVCSWPLGCSELAGLEDPLPIPDASGDAPEEFTPAAPEVCNLVDDNGDGTIDEGFPWRLGQTREVATATHVEALRAVRMVDGRVALAWVDGVQDGVEAVRAATLDATGARTDGPTDVVSVAALHGFGITACPLDAEFGVAVGEDAAGAEDGGAAGHRIRIERYATQDLHPLGTRFVEDLDWETPVVAPEALLDLTCTSAGYAYLAIDATHQPWLLWLDQVFHNGKGVLTGARGTEGALSSGLLVGWTVSGVGENGLQTVACGMVSPGGYRQVLKPKEIAMVGGGVGVFQEPSSRAVAWLDADLVVGASRGGVTTPYTVVSRERSDGVQAATLGLEMASRFHSVVSFRGSLVASTWPESGGTRLFRADSGFHLTGTEPIVMQDTSVHALVGDGAAPLVIWASDDGTRILAAPLECE